METGDIAFKLRMRFDICCIASEEGRVPQVEEDPSVLYRKCMCHIRIKLGHYLTSGWDYAVSEAEGPEEIFRVVELSNNMPDKVDLLDRCGVGFFKSFLGDKNRKEDIDNCILACESALHLAPQDSLDIYRLNILGVSHHHRFNLTGDLSDISQAILYQQKVFHLTPEGDADMPFHLNNLGTSFQSRFVYTGDLADISKAISYQQKAVHLTPEGHANMHL
jgi:hypothetical protein